MPMVAKTTQKLAAFASDRRGNFAVVFAALSSALLLTVGYGINTAQLFNAKSALDQALDSAITSTARDLTTGKIAKKDARAMVETFLKANIGSGFADAGMLTLDGLTVDETAKTVSASASVDVALAFPMPGSDRMRRVAGRTAAVYSDKKIEIAMMLDITGSMKPVGRTNKIGDLKAAATEAVEDLLDGVDPGRPRVRVAIVPYADAVNVGPALAPYVHYETKFTAGEPPAYSDLRSVSLRSRADNCATERKGRNQFTDASPYAAMVNRDSRLGFCPRAKLSPLSANAGALTKSIAAFEPNGSTAGHIGIQWTWYMLSKAWARVLPAASAPSASDPKAVKKIAILMTDGEFNTAFANVRDGDDPRGQPAKSQDKAETLCRAMRDDGIEVFTIGFMLDTAAAKRVLANCASPDSPKVRHYYDTADGAALAAAFDEIVANIERLALTE